MATDARLRRFASVAGCLAGFVLAIVVYRCVPGWTLPGLGQPLWVSTFARSIANQGLVGLWSHNTGAPLPSPMSFGLPGAWTMAVLLIVGAPPPAAYGFMCTAWLAVAYAGAIRLGGRLDIPFARAVLLATVWLCMPMVWAHAPYSMLSIGMAMLPAYLVPVIDACRVPADAAWRARGRLLARLCAVAIISAFMDGYTFVMYALASAALLLTSAGMAWRAERRIVVRGLVLQIIALLVAGACYRLYIGQSSYWVAPESAFRGWGTDIAFMVRPTTGTSWVADALGLGSARDVDLWFGDQSVWQTTFVLPLFLAALVCMARARHASGWRVAAVAILVIGTWMSLGPSVKAWSMRADASVQADGDTHFMPATAARMPSGTGWIATHAPVLNNMRATYRWMALGMLGMWLVVALSLRRGQPPGLGLAAAWIVLVLAIPPLSSHNRDGHALVRMWRQVDHDLLKPFREGVPHGSVVAGLPRENDFLLGYLAAQARVVTFNTGGDKNIAAAEPHWPSVMRNTPPGQMPPDLTAAAYQLFASGAATVLMVPFYQEPMASHAWPCVAVAREAMTDVADMSGACPSDLAATARVQLDAVAAAPGLRVWRTPNFALVMPDRDLRSPTERDAWSLGVWPERPSYPFSPGDLAGPLESHVLVDGWSPVEGDHVWSADRAALRLPLPSECAAHACTVRLIFHTFAASRWHARRVSITSGDVDAHTTSTTDDLQALALTLPAGRPLATLRITVADARTPASVSPESTDNRLLGIALFRLEVAPAQ